jgi:hypothetical protein
VSVARLEDFGRDHVSIICAGERLDPHNCDPRGIPWITGLTTRTGLVLGPAVYRTSCLAIPPRSLAC